MLFAVVLAYSLVSGAFKWSGYELRTRAEQLAWWGRTITRIAGTALVVWASPRLETAAIVVACAFTYKHNVAGAAPDSGAKVGTVLVTGATSGIGRAAAAELARRGVDVVVPGRNPSKAAATAEAIAARSIECPLELSDQKSVRTYAAALRKDLRKNARPLTTLVLNAGAMVPEREVTEDGAELTMASNHLGHFTLTKLLLPELQDAAKIGYDCRVVVVSSSLHRLAARELDGDGSDLTLPGEFSMFGAYARSKFANVLFAEELARRVDAVAVVALHPGLVITNVTRSMLLAARLAHLLLLPLFFFFQKLPSQGARTTVHACLAPISAARGAASYLEDCRVVEAATASMTRAAEVARELWDASEAYAARAEKRSAPGPCC